MSEPAVDSLLPREPRGRRPFLIGLLVGAVVGVALGAFGMTVREHARFRGKYDQTMHWLDRIAEQRPEGVPERNWDEMIGGAKTTVANTIFSRHYLQGANHVWLNDRLYKDALDRDLTPVERLERFYAHTRRLGPKADAYVTAWKPQFHDAWIEGAKKPH